MLIKIKTYNGSKSNTLLSVLGYTSLHSCVGLFYLTFSPSSSPQLTVTTTFICCTCLHQIFIRIFQQADFQSLYHLTPFILQFPFLYLLLLFVDICIFSLYNNSNFTSFLTSWGWLYELSLHMNSLQSNII